MCRCHVNGGRVGALAQENHSPLHVLAESPDTPRRRSPPGCRWREKYRPASARRTGRRRSRSGREHRHRERAPQGESFTIHTAFLLLALLKTRPIDARARAKERAGSLRANPARPIHLTTTIDKKDDRPLFRTRSNPTAPGSPLVLCQVQGRGDSDRGGRAIPQSSLQSVLLIHFLRQSEDRRGHLYRIPAANRHPAFETFDISRAASRAVARNACTIGERSPRRCTSASGMCGTGGASVR